MPYAHSRNASGEYHDLVDHLRGVAVLAEEFATPLDAGHLARFLGLWHDIGKFHPDWQRYLQDCEADTRHRGHGPDHKAAGAHLASEHVQPLSLLVQGHHGGLHSPTEFRAWIHEKLSGTAVSDAILAARAAIPDLEPNATLSVPRPAWSDKRAADVFLRLLFSALVDADYLDTERHLLPERTSHRGPEVGLETLWQRFQDHQRMLTEQPDTPVNRVRREIAHICLTAADQPPGLFRLAVPTGGGKTLSAMGFALRHALRRGHQRIIVAVPFITITEQTADVYRRVFSRADDSTPAVLEHHSGVGAEASTESDDGDFRPAAGWSRLAAENWDAPIVVTTTVQLFQSLFANRPAAMRKLHRLARSVIILDEAQALPKHLLDPILDALRHLCAGYGCTVVLSTATQPAFEVLPAFADLDAREIVPHPERFFTQLRRVSIDWHVDPALSWAEIADILRPEARSLAVLNTKRDALALLDALADPAALHLSTLLCGAHRRQVIADVRHRLAANRPCRLVSTQVIEAGVDLDFPFALRAMGPFDSIIQTAGRCNREGRLATLGRVVVVQPVEGGLPRGGAYGLSTDITRTFLGAGPLDPDDPAQVHKYFVRIFGSLGRHGTDEPGIQALREAFDFPEVARLFRMIEPTDGVVITQYGSPEDRAWVHDALRNLRRGAPHARFLLRRLQPYLVSIYSHQVRQFQRQNLLTEVEPGLWEWLGDYDPVRGLVADRPTLDSLVV